MAALKDLVIELQMNQFAYFSSGYRNQPNPTDNLDQAIPYRRDTWKISKCEIVCELVEFGPEVL